MKINSNQINSYNTILKNNVSKTSITEVGTQKSTNIQKRDTVELSSLQDKGKMKQVIESSIKNGISLVKTMDKSLADAEGIAGRLSELSKNYKKSNFDRKEDIEEEAVKLLNDLGNVFKNTTYNGEKVFEKKNHSIFTGEKSTYNIQTPTLSTFDKYTQVKPEVKTNTPSTISQNISNNVLNLSLLQTVASVTTEPIDIEEYVTPTSTTVQQSSATTEPTKNKALLETESATTSTSVEDTSNSTSNGKKKDRLSKEEKREIQDTLDNVFYSKKETREFFEVRNEKQLMDKIQTETSGSLQNRFEEKGTEEQYNKAIKEGLFEELGLENPINTIEKPLDNSQPIKEETTLEETNNSSESKDSLHLSDILESDFIQKNLVELIQTQRKFLEVHESMLKSKLNGSTNMGGSLPQENQYHQTPTTYDVFPQVSKLKVERLKSYSLSQYSNAITFHNLDAQKQGILQLLR